LEEKKDNKIGSEVLYSIYVLEGYRGIKTINFSLYELNCIATKLLVSHMEPSQRVVHLSFGLKLTHYIEPNTTAGKWF